MSLVRCGEVFVLTMQGQRWATWDAVPREHVQNCNKDVFLVFRESCSAFSESVI